MNSLLPPNASELERNIEQVVVYSTDLPVRIAELWNPFSCPLSLLPWLAWAFSVDEWDDRWPEHIKRQMVQNSFDVHRYKGTPYAVQKALDGLNIKSHVREWWEADGNQQPGTMTAVALINENLTDNDDGLLTKEMLEQVTRVIKTAKRGVIHFDVELGLSLDESFGLSGGIGPSIGLMAHSAELIPVVPDAMSGGVGLSGGIGPSIGFMDHSAELIPVVPDAMSGGVGLSGGIGPSIGLMDHFAHLVPVVPDLVFSSVQLSIVSYQLCLFDICFEGII